MLAGVQRLGKNIGGYHGERIDVQQTREAIESAARNHGWSVSHLPAREHRLPILTRAAQAPTAPRLYVSSGMHGDEPAGPLALLQLLQENRWPDAHLTLAPLLNPGGLARNTRENEDGIDINRDYRHFRSAEAQTHAEWLKAQPAFDLTLLLHEDWESHGFYCYELNPDHRPSLARTILDAVAPVCPIDPTDLIDGRPISEPGIIRPMEWPDFNPDQRPEWPEAVWLGVNKTRLNYTLEAPSDWPIAIRINALAAAVRAAVDTHFARLTQSTTP
jgi:hypothetical protein